MFFIYLQEEVVNSMMKLLMKGDGTTLYDKYQEFKNKPSILSAFINYDLTTKYTMDQRFTLRGAIDQRFRLKDQLKKEAEQNFQLVRTGLHPPDQEYIDKIKVRPTNSDGFMTDEDLIAERAKLISMANLITEELNVRSFIPEDMKSVMKYVSMCLIQLDKVCSGSESPPPCSSSSSSAPQLLEPLIPGMPIVAETADVTAVRVADVEVEEINDEDEDD